MPQLTEEHKQKMAEGRKRAAAERAAKQAGTEKGEPEREPADAADAEPVQGFSDPVVEMKRLVGLPAGVRYYGPYPTSPGEGVSTPHGLYGIEKHQVMWFVPGKAQMEKGGKIIDTMLAVRAHLPKELAERLIAMESVSA